MNNLTTPGAPYLVIISEMDTHKQLAVWTRYWSGVETQKQFIRNCADAASKEFPYASAGHGLSTRVYPMSMVEKLQTIPIEILQWLVGVDAWQVRDILAYLQSQSK